MSKAAKGHIALFVVQIIYALNYSFAKDLMPAFMNPMSIVVCRVTVSAILFWLLSLFVKTQKIERKDLLKLFWLALFGVCLNQVFFMYGLYYTTPINSAIIMISNPVFVLIITLIVFKTRIRFMQIIGLAFAITGAVMILRYRGNFEVGSETILGDILTLINSIFWGLFIVTAKPIMQKYNTISVMRWVFLFGSIYVLPFGVDDMIDTNWSNFTAHAWFSIGFVVIATTFVAYLLNVYGLETLSAETVSAYIYMQPLLAALFAIIGGKDVMTTTKLISGIFIIFGLYLLNIKTKKSEHD